MAFTSFAASSLSSAMISSKVAGGFGTSFLLYSSMMASAPTG